MDKETKIINIEDIDVTGQWVTATLIDLSFIEEPCSCDNKHCKVRAYTIKTEEGKSFIRSFSDCYKNIEKIIALRLNQ